MPVPLPYPSLVATHAGIWRADADGETRAVSRAESVRRLADTPHLLLGARQVAQRLGLADVSGLDLLELFAFVAPAQFLVPSVTGFARYLGMAPPSGPADEPVFLQRAAARLVATLAAPGYGALAGSADSLHRLQRHGWPWAPVLAAALPEMSGRAPPLFQALAEWEDAAPRPTPQVRVLREADVGERLRHLAGDRREPRDGQRAYAIAALHAFQPRDSRDGPNLVVAQAGTGIGKTLGYLAPASLYADATGGQVWLSTYTRALQRQLRAECALSLPEQMAAGDIVVRKGRENYLCLLNLEDAVQGGLAGRHAQFAELVARWARFSTDGDMAGGDLPGWLPGLFRRGSALPALSDRRGECIRAACPHYRRCFIEKSIRAAAGASLVIANHALVMATVAHADDEQENRRLVFDEGHHLHSAADSAFAIALTGGEMIELRRWLLGPDRPGRRAGRRRGLAARLLDVSSYDPQGGAALEALTDTAQALPAADWLARLDAGEPRGPLEGLLAQIRTHVLLHASDAERGFSLEAAIAALPAGLPEAVDAAAQTLGDLRRALLLLHVRLLALLREQPAWLDPPGLSRIGSAADGLQQRLDLLAAWLRLLARLTGEAESEFVDWLTLVRAEGRELDCGIMRHWLDPAKPLADAVLAPAPGVLVTSATLGDPPEAAAGASHLAVPAQLFDAESPFDYAQAARIFIVTDIRRHDVAALALAYHRLIEAADGGTLGLFTAISRLRAVHSRLADRMARAGLPLFAQHVDPVDTGTLVDLFRADACATLLGTDALRDGVDVPGDSLRQIIFEGVPWSRPTILNQARRAAFGGSAHEDMQVRHRLRQAFGRLIRSADDRGVFVLLGAAVPSRLLAAFPPAVPVVRLPLEQAATEIRTFLGGDCATPPAFVTGSDCLDLGNG